MTGGAPRLVVNQVQGHSELTSKTRLAMNMQVWSPPCCPLFCPRSKQNCRDTRKALLQEMLLIAPRCCSRQTPGVCAQAYAAAHKLACTWTPLTFVVPVGAGGARQLARLRRAVQRLAASEGAYLFSKS